MKWNSVYRDSSRVHKSTDRQVDLMSFPSVKCINLLVCPAAFCKPVRTQVSHRHLGAIVKQITPTVSARTPQFPDFGDCQQLDRSCIGNWRSSAAKMETVAEKDRGLVIVIMGVSGAGKSTIGELLSKNLDCPFLDADDFHPDESKDKMRNGIPLSEHDRRPWLEKLRKEIAQYILSGQTAVLACSALRKSYRLILRSAGDGTGTRGKVVFVHLNGSQELFESRLAARFKEGKHFMPPTLLQSQLNLFEEEDDADFKSCFISVDASLSPDVLVKQIEDELYTRKYLS